MLENCFYQLTHLPLLDKKSTILELARSTFVEPEKEIKGVYTSRTSKAKSTFENTRFVQDLGKEFGTVKSYFVKFTAMTVYDWHCDVDRHCTINFLLSNSPKATTLFREPISRLVYNIIECPYTMFQPVLFNTTIPHCVVNLNPTTRFMLSLDFKLGVKFNSVKEFLFDYKTESY
jgi:hypothetical protein